MIDRLRHIELMGFGQVLGLMVLCCMAVGCSDDDRADEATADGVRFVMDSYIDNTESEGLCTRGLPSGYSSDYSQFAPSGTAASSQIGIFIIKDDGAATTDFSMAGTFNYTSGGNWETFIPNDKIDGTGNYMIFGYMPADMGTPGIKIDRTTKSGVMTITDINPLLNTDMGVVVGVADQSENLAEGSYVLDVKYTGDQANSLALLLNHVCTELNIKMSIGTAYAKHRKVKVNCITIATSTNKGDLKVTLPTSTTALSTEFVGGETASTTESLTMQYDKALTTDKNLMASFYCVGSSKQTFTMTTSYDVYDVYDLTEAKVLRSGTAVNTFTSNNVFYPGLSYNLNITVTPTYLYKLTEEDMNDPGFVFGE